MLRSASRIGEAQPAARYEHFTPDSYLDEIVGYLRARGLTADGRDGTHLMRTLLELAVREPDRRMSVTRAARLMYVCRRTLTRHCKRAGLPRPSHILALGRILHATRLLRETGWTLSRVAAATGWPDPFSLSNAMHRLTGLRPTEARKRGLIYVAEAWLRTELKEGNIELREPAPPECPSCGQEVAPDDSTSQEEGSCPEP